MKSSLSGDKWKGGRESESRGGRRRCVGYVNREPTGGTLERQVPR